VSALALGSGEDISVAEMPIGGCGRRQLLLISAPTLSTFFGGLLQSVEAARRVSQPPTPFQFHAILPLGGVAR
jgi:hypothetical protein